MMSFFKNIYNFLFPPNNWRFTVMILSAVLIGIVFFILYISNAASYLSDKPETCINCHVMNSQYASWQHSSHFRVATCNDCHVPHNNAFRKYFFKASDGLRHSIWFTMRWEPQVIKIKDAGIGVVQENCIRCHINLVETVSLVNVTGENSKHGIGKLCWDCHRETPHGTVGSLSSAPNALIPILDSPVPNWINSKKYKSENKNSTIKKK